MELGNLQTVGQSTLGKKSVGHGLHRHAVSMSPIVPVLNC